MSRSRAACIVITAALLASSCSKRVSEQECELLLDHYTEHLLRNENPHVAPHTIARKQAEARSLAKSDESFEFHSCSDSVSREQFECAIIAPSIDAIEKCLVL